MQTTLRIDDALYRRAKAQAALEGVTLAKFLEDGIRLRLSRAVGAPVPVDLPIYEGARPFDLPPERLKQMDLAAQEETAAARLSTPPHP